MIWKFRKELLRSHRIETHWDKNKRDEKQNVSYFIKTFIFIYRIVITISLDGR